MDAWERRKIAARHEALHTAAAKRFGHRVLEVHTQSDFSGLTTTGFSVDRHDRDYLIQRGVEHGIKLLLPFCLRTTYSGVCFFLVAMLMSSLPAHNVGRMTSNDLDPLAGVRLLSGDP